MAVMDEFKEEREKIKQAPLKEKLDYYWYYYKFHLIGTIITVFFLSSMIYGFITRLPVALNVTMVNTFENEIETQLFKEEFANTLGLSLDEYDYDFDSNTILDHQNQDMNYLASQQKLIGLISARAIDVFVADTFTYLSMIGTGMYIDLRNVFTQEELEKYSNYLFYVDSYLLENPNETANMKDEELANSTNPRKPEDMIKPTPIGIYIPQESIYINSYKFIHDEMVMGVVANSEKIQQAKAFIEFVMQN